MARGVTHFAVGAALTTLVTTYLVPRAPYPRLLAVLGGAWAMLPDAHLLVPDRIPALRALHYSRAADLFWFHRTLDRLDERDSIRAGVLAIGLYAIVTAIAERRGYRTPESVRRRWDSGEALRSSVAVG